MKAAINRKGEQLKVYFVLDETLEIISLGPAWQSITGFELKECFGRPFLSFFEPGQSDELLSVLSKMNDDPHYAPKFILNARSSQKVPVEIVMECLPWNSNLSIYMGILNTDNTKIDIPENIQDSEKRIFKNNFSDDSSIYSWPEGFWDWDLNNDNVHFSLQLWEMLGYQQEEVKSESNIFPELLYEEDKGSFPG